MLPCSTDEVTMKVNASSAKKCLIWMQILTEIFFSSIITPKIIPTYNKKSHLYIRNICVLMTHQIL